MIFTRERTDGILTYFPADKRKLKCMRCSNRASQRLERDTTAVIVMCPKSLLGISLHGDAGVFFSSSQWGFYCGRIFPASPGPPLYPDFFTKLLSVHLAVDRGVNLYRDINEMVGRPAWCHLLVAWLPKMVARSSEEQWWAVDCIPGEQASMGTCLSAALSLFWMLILFLQSLGYLRKLCGSRTWKVCTPLMNKWLLLLGIREQNTSMHVGFSFPEP